MRSYFGGRLVGQQLGANIYEPVIQDRLGSVGKYYPYGEERNSPQLPNDQVKFATYTRDSATGNDYADQRYYTSTLGRFMTPDPYVANRGGAGDSSDPRSWNRYAYSGEDPINYYDPEGRFYVPAPQPPQPEPAPQIPGLQYPISSAVPQGFTPSLTELGLSLVAFESTFLQNELNQYLNSLQSQNSPCLSQLETLTGKSFAQIEAVANNTQYFDLTSAAVGSSRLRTLDFLFRRLKRT